MILIDTHCHLYSEEFNNDVEAIIFRAKENNVKKFLLPAIDSTTHAAMFEVEKNFSNECFAMIGLHPCSVKENVEEELMLVKQWLDKRKFIAIGEIGLDFYWDKTFTEQQYAAFEMQMQWALNLQLPIVIHTRNAMKETIEAVTPFAKKGLKGIFHCFGESYEIAKQIIDLDFLLGIGGVVTYKKSGLAETLKNISLQHIVLETDAPYLTPVPFRGKRNESSYLKYIAEKIAEIKNISVEEVANNTTTNAEKLFRNFSGE
ncbi:MAG: TatD family hydrolase [Bacteroidetes bacterium]|nr:TatD family hydrolase [Bacteroidota bacterium]MBS1649803.1 TatD family hydrolase [Bacteroidota bacterium]